MTLIACTINKGNPFLIGDILISSPRSEGIELPTNSFDVTKYLDENTDKPTELAQKIYIVNNNLCIGVAGDYNECYQFLTVLTHFFSKKKTYDIKEENIIKFFQIYNLDKNFKESSFFLLLMEQSDTSNLTVRQFTYQQEDWRMITSPIFNDVWASGTGADEFLSQITQVGDLKHNFDNPDLAQLTNFLFIAKLLAIEKVTGLTIKEHWGAGFETIYYNGKSFQKFNEFTYLVLICYFDKNGDLSTLIPELVMHYKYHNDLLTIASIEITQCSRHEINGVTTIISKDKPKLFEVPPLSLNPSRTKANRLRNYSFQTRKIALGFCIIKENESIVASSMFSSDIAATFEQGEGLEIVFGKETEDKIRHVGNQLFSKI